MRDTSWRPRNRQVRRRSFGWGAPRRSLVWAAVCACVGLAGCDAGGGSIPPGDPPTRPSDGLLQRPDLQAVVDLQVARDAQGLVALLGDGDPTVRARAAFALGSVQAAGAVPSLQPLLGDPDAGVRRDAAFALGQAGVPEAVGVLTSAFPEESDPSVRFRLLEALGKLGTPAAADALLAAQVADGEEPRRSLSLARLMAVHGVRHQGAQDHLLARLDDTRGGVRWSAAYYLGRQPEPGVWAPRVARVRSALDGYALDDPAAMHLVQGLGRLADPSDAARMRRWATEAADWRTRANAVAALGMREADPETLETLFSALDDPSTHVAGNAAQGLARGTYPPSTTLRVRQWVEANPDRVDVAGPLLALLARHDEREFVFAWMDTLPLTEEVHWNAALVALQFLSGRDVVERLGRVAGAPSSVLSSRAVGGLAQRWTRDRSDPSVHDVYFELFRSATAEAPGLAARQAAPALADSAFAPLGNVAALISAYEGMAPSTDAESMIAVLGSLGLIGGPDVIAFLRSQLGQPDRGVRSAAANALSRLTGESFTPEALGLDTLPEPASGAGPDPAVIDWEYVSSLGGSPRLVLDTERGTVVVRLFTEEAPHTVQTITRIASAGLYDGVAFHRVVPNFVVQGGDFSRGDGNGGPGYSITTELTLVSFERGVIGMASAGKDTEGSQFFINHVATPHLDGGYTSFGVVEEGIDVVDDLHQGSRILRARIETPG